MLQNQQRTNHLLVIGIDDYVQCPKLNNAVKDAKDLISVLMELYDFREENITALFDEAATEKNVIQTFRKYAQTLSADDNLLIYFSGHGYFDNIFNEGYWIPVNGELGHTNDYIPNSRIITMLKAIKSQHTALIIDSCFSGTLFSQVRSVGHRFAVKASRWALASGRNEVVSDGSIGGNSPFAVSVLEFLKDNKSPMLLFSDLVQYVKIATSRNASQTPIGSPLQNVGDKGGEFVFHLKKMDTEPQQIEEIPSIISKKEKTTDNTIKENIEKIEKKSMPQNIIQPISKLLQPDDFQFIKPFQQGYSIFRKNELWGYVNHEDKVVLKPQFYQAYSFLNDKALVRTTSNVYQYFSLDNQLINAKEIAINQPTLIQITVVKSDFQTIICNVSAGIVQQNQTLELFDKNNNRQIVTVAEVKYRGIAVDSAKVNQSIEIITKERLINREAMILAAPDSMIITQYFEGEAFLKSLVHHDNISPFPSSFYNNLNIYNIPSLAIKIDIQGDVQSWKKHQNFDIVARIRNPLPLRVGQLLKMKGSRGGECQVRKTIK